MIISNLKREHVDNKIRISSQVIWENCDEPEKLVFMETPEQFGKNMELNPAAFLVGCIIPALYFGEKRIKMEWDICPVLLEGLETVMALMKMWSNQTFIPLDIQVGTSASPAIIPGNANSKNRAAMVFSGGIDSLAALRLNRQRYPENHPGYIKDCFFIHGFDIGGVQARGMKYHIFNRAVVAMQKITDQAGATLIPVYTNIRHLCDNRELWLNHFFGAVLAAVAHSFSPHINLLYIASSYDLYNLEPCGSHPLLDPEYSSFDLKIRHRDLSWSRIKKIELISKWDTALTNMRVCLANVTDQLNCGTCEKCVRTMTGLVAIDALKKCDAFMENDVTPDMFDAFKITIRHRAPFYKELLPLLKQQGRYDLTEVIEKKLNEK